MSYRNTVETRVADFVVGQYIVFPTTDNGTWSGTFEGFGERLGRYAREGAVDIVVRLENGEIHTLRSSRLYLGYMTPVEVEEEEDVPEPKRALYEVQMPVKGEVIFQVVATSEEDAQEIVSDWPWDEGELNLEHDDSLFTYVVVID